LNHWLDLIMFVAAAAGGLRRNNSKSSSQSPLGNSSNSAINGDNNNGHSANATPLLEGGPGSNNGPIAHTGAGGQAQQLVDQEATSKSARVELVHPGGRGFRPPILFIGRPQVTALGVKKTGKTRKRQCT
jgi:hypothetical protein